MKPFERMNLDPVASFPMIAKELDMNEGELYLNATREH